MLYMLSEDDEISIPVLASRDDPGGRNRPRQENIFGPTLNVECVCTHVNQLDDAHRFDGGAEFESAN